MNVLAMVIQIAVKNIGIGRGQSPGRTDQSISPLAALIKSLSQGVLVAQPEKAVHLLPISTGRKAAEFRERPIAGEIGIVALVGLVAGNAQGDVLAFMKIGEKRASLGFEKIRHEAAPNFVIAAIRKQAS